jgi:hypothetical protein
MQDTALLGEIGNWPDGLATNRPMPARSEHALPWQVRPGRQDGKPASSRKAFSSPIVVISFMASQYHIRPPRIYIAWTLP